MDFNNDSGTLSNVSVISSAVSNLTLTNTGSLVLPTGTTGERPTFANGLIRYNSDSGYVEAASGSEWVNITNAGNNVAQIYADTLEPTGYVNQTDSEMFFDDATRTFTIQPKSPATSFSYYIFGVKYTISTTKTIQIADVEGSSYIYFAADSELHVITTFNSDTLLRNNAYTCALYWDATNKKALLFGEERHGMVMDGNTHAYLHSSFGTQYSGGLGVTNLSLDGTGDNNANAQLGVSNGSIRDEDILFTITDGQWQDISPIAQIPVYYRVGAGAGLWRVKPATAYPLIHSGTVAGYGGTRCAYNQNTGAAWQLTEIGNSDTFLIHIYAAPNFRAPIIAVLGQSHYTSVSMASDAAFTEIRHLTLAGLPFTEFTPIASIIVESSSGYANVPKARFRSLSDGSSYIDWRGSTAKNLQAAALALPATSINLVGDATGTGITGGNTTVTLNTVNGNVGVFGSATTVPQFTVDGKGRITSVSNVAIASGGTGTVTSVAALTLGTTGTDLSSTVATSTSTPVITLNVPTASATNRGVLSSTDWTTFNSKLSSNQTITVSGDATGSGATAIALTLANTTVTSGAYGSTTQVPTFTVNSKGLITAAANVTIPAGTISVTGGDLTLSGNTGTAITNATLSTVNGNIGTFGDATTIPVITVNAKGLVTSVSNITVAGGGGNGTVTSASVTSANGFAGTVATATTTPAITLSTTVTGMLKGNGTAISAGVSGTDYSAGTAALATGILKSTTTTGTLSIAIEGIDYVAAPTGSGVPIQSKNFAVAAASGTASKADSNVAPVITDGTQIWTAAITPKRSTSTVAVLGSFYIDHTTNNRRIVVAIWRTVAAVNTLVGVSAAFITASNNGGEIAISFNDLPATTSACTYTMRVWANGSGTWYVSQGATAYFAGNLAKQVVRLQELA
jgi:hypothetical protein